MATLGPNGEVQFEPSDIIAREVAHKTDDPQHITNRINELNTTITTAEDLAKAIEEVDAMRREYQESLPKGDEDNPHIAETDTQE